jgi:hypothetical protein
MLTAIHRIAGTNNDTRQRASLFDKQIGRQPVLKTPANRHSERSR